jgi:hypothetical protein
VRVDPAAPDPVKPIAKRRLKRVCFGVGVAIAIAILLAFPFGPLFPWSPWKPGYREVHLDRTDVVFAEGTALDPVYREIDRYVAEAEVFHRLAAPRRLTLVACRDWADFERFMPHLRGRVHAAVAIVTGTVIYVTPKTAERGLDVGEFLRHEISHAVLHQNQSVWAASRIGKIEWLTEGLAVSYGRQKAFFSREEFLRRANEVPLLPVIDPDRRGEAVPWNMRFAYPTWRYFTEYLRAKHGDVRFDAYLRRCLATPGDWREHFSPVFGVEFAAAVEAYQRELRAKSWMPEA